jgi:hypothetical protein
MLRKYHFLVHDDSEIVYGAHPIEHETTQLVWELHRMHWKILLKKELYVIGVEEYTYIIENLQYSVDKPDKAKWSQMTSLWNIQCHLDILRTCVTDSYLLNYPWHIGRMGQMLDRNMYGQCDFIALNLF